MMMGKTGLVCSINLQFFVLDMLHFIYMASKAHARHCSLTITGNTKDPNDDDALWKINYNADRTTDVVVNEHFCRWEVHTEKPSVAPSFSPSFLPSLPPSGSPSLAVSGNKSDISIENDGQDSEPNISNDGILLSVFIFTALDASLIITELSAIIIFTTQLATLWHSIKQSKYSTIWRTQCQADSISSPSLKANRPSEV